MKGIERDEVDALRDKLQFEALISPAQHDAQLLRSAADMIARLQCKLDEVNERLHYADGVADLAMKHRDEAESRLRKGRWGNDTPS